MTEPQPTETLLSAIYHVLRAERRRHVIRILRESDSRSFTTRELARQISSIEQEIPESNATGEPYRNAYNALSQTHLPTLSDAGVIIYDPNRQTVRRGPYFELASLLLDSNIIMAETVSRILQANRPDEEFEPQSPID